LRKKGLSGTIGGGGKCKRLQRFINFGKAGGGKAYGVKKVHFFEGEKQNGSGKKNPVYVCRGVMGSQNRGKSSEYMEKGARPRWGGTHNLRGTTDQTNDSTEIETGTEGKKKGPTPDETATTTGKRIGGTPNRTLLFGELLLSGEEKDTQESKKGRKLFGVKKNALKSQ